MIQSFVTAIVFLSSITTLTCTSPPKVCYDFTEGCTGITKACDRIKQAKLHKHCITCKKCKSDDVTYKCLIIKLEGQLNYSQLPFTDAKIVSYSTLNPYKFSVRLRKNQTKNGNISTIATPLTKTTATSLTATLPTIVTTVMPSTTNTSSKSFTTTAVLQTTQVKQYTTATSILDSQLLSNKSGLTQFLNKQLHDLKSLLKVSRSFGKKLSKTADQMVSSLASNKWVDHQVGENIRSMLGSVCEKIQLEEDEEFVNIGSNFELKAVDVSVQSFVKDPNNSFKMSPQSSSASISLPSEVFQYTENLAPKTQNRIKRSVDDKVRLSFQYYPQNTSLFYTEMLQSPDISISEIISASLSSSGKQIQVKNLQNKILIQYGSVNQTDNNGRINSSQFFTLEQELECVFWDGSKWASEGCCLENLNGSPQCYCNHLTNFALLIKSDIKLSTPALSIISDIGCYISIVCIFLTIVVYSTNKKALKMKAIKIFLNILVNLEISLILFKVGVTKTENKHVCIAITAAIHYFLLVTWCWKTAYAYEIYLSIVQVFQTSKAKYIQKRYIICYSMPLLIVGIVILVSFTTDSYHSTSNLRLCNNQEEHSSQALTYMASNMCWLHGLPLTIGFLLPVGILLLANIVVFYFVIAELFKKKKSSSPEIRQTKDNLLLSITIALTMGLTWLTAFLLLISDNEIYFQVTSWLFALTCTFQGFLIFIFSVLRRKNLWPEFITNSSYLSFGKKTLNISSMEMVSTKSH